MNTDSMNELQKARQSIPAIPEYDLPIHWIPVPSLSDGLDESALSEEASQPCAHCGQEIGFEKAYVEYSHDKRGAFVRVHVDCLRTYLLQRGSQA